MQETLLVSSIHNFDVPVSFHFSSIHVSILQLSIVSKSPMNSSCSALLSLLHLSMVQHLQKTIIHQCYCNSLNVNIYVSLEHKGWQFSDLFCFCNHIRKENPLKLDSRKLENVSYRFPHLLQPCSSLMMLFCSLILSRLPNVIQYTCLDDQGCLILHLTISQALIMFQLVKQKAQGEKSKATENIAEIYLVLLIPGSFQEVQLCPSLYLPIMTVV